jgi:hypothetical protein
LSPYGRLHARKQPDAAALRQIEHPICKAANMAHNFGATSTLMHLLLNRLGYFDGFLFVLPNRPLPLVYGSGYKEEACSDLTVLDMAMWPLMAITEDRHVNDPDDCSVEAQLVAEQIAIVQTHLDGQGSKRTSYNSDALAAEPVLPPFVGVRTNGVYFWFYHIADPSDLLDCLAARSRAHVTTAVRKLGGDQGLCFAIPREREVIIRTLDSCSCYYRALGMKPEPCWF